MITIYLMAYLCADKPRGFFPYCPAIAIERPFETFDACTAKLNEIQSSVQSFKPEKPGMKPGTEYICVEIKRAPIPLP
jgi:hypothetical protein